MCRLLHLCHLFWKVGIQRDSSLDNNCKDIAGLFSSDNKVLYNIQSLMRPFRSM